MQSRGSEGSVSGRGLRALLRGRAAWIALGVTAAAVALGAAARGRAAGGGAEVIPAQVRALHTLADLGTNVDSFCATLVDNAKAEAANAESAIWHGLDAQARTRWLDAIQAACQPEQARERHLAGFAAGYDAEAARAVTDWYTHETGRRLLALEAAAAETDWDAEVTPFLQQYDREPVPLERVELSERIDAATGATEDAALLQAGIASILSFGVRALAPAAERVPREQIDAEVEALRQSLVHQMRRQQSIVFLFVYREASTAELAAFADFTETPAARWLFASHRMAMLQLISEVREDVEKRLGG